MTVTLSNRYFLALREFTRQEIRHLFDPADSRMHPVKAVVVATQDS